MDIRDLMIGDWVNVPKLNKPVRVDAVYRTMIMPNPDDDDVHSLIGDEYLEPIPLTEKILEYNFATEPQISWCVGWNRKDDIHIEIKREDINAAFYGVIAYVHQLQHSLAICGINKEIKLEG